MPTDVIPASVPTLPIGRAIAPHATPSPPPGLLAGRYHLVRLVGSGGMGDVYEAEQRSPVRRTVAVKLVRAGPDARDIAPRLEAERQAMARLAHPNIAVVHDAGTAPDGRPFVVMEYVPGAAVTEYAVLHRLGVAERVELFRAVCAAVQHAHHKGIIHRDLKPGNVLVTHTDAGPVPKVIDFGLAKAVRVPLTDARMTAAGVILGTPLYMAPEQTDPAADVDTRADVFALGVILYELLSGTTPLDHVSFQRADPAEQFRRIRAIDPPPPSARADDPAVARRLRGDLDAVTLKALARDPADRYPTAAALADDLRRVLADEPVSIGRTTARTRAMRFVRRNRAAVSAGALVFLALAAGVAGTSVGLARSVRAETAAKAALAQVEVEKAETAAALARVEAEKAETATALGRVDAERKKVAAARDHTREALEAATDVNTAALLQHHPQLSAADRAQLTRLADLIARLDADSATPTERVAWLARVALLHEKLGDQQKAADAFARAVAVAEADTAHPVHCASTQLKQARHFALTGRLDEADAAYRKAIHRLAALDGELVTVSRIEAHEGLAEAHARSGRGAESAAEAKKALAVAEDAKAAGALHRDATPHVAKSHSHLAVAARHHRQPADALAHQRAALAAWRDSEPDLGRPAVIHGLASAHLNLAPYLSELGRIDEAKVACRDAIRLAEGGLSRFPGMVDLRVLLGTATNNLAGMHAMGGDFRGAVPLFTKGVEILEPLAGGAAGDQTAVRKYLMMGRFGRAMAKLHVNDEAGAEADFRRATDGVVGEERMHMITAIAVQAIQSGRAEMAARFADDLLKLNGPGTAERAAHFYALCTTLPLPAAAADRHAASAVAAIRMIPPKDRAKTAVSHDPRLHSFRKRPGVADALAGTPLPQAPAPRPR